jgi:hypothetical protein
MSQTLPRAGVLKRWGARTKRVRCRRPTDGLAGLSRMITVSRRRVKLENAHLLTLLERSHSLLHPLDDPLLEDFGAHRWLDTDREEAYSDWLAWILSKLRTPERILAVFGEKLDPGAWGPVEARVGREYSVEAGHVDRTGRVDIHIEFPPVALIWIELKLTSAEDADMVKNTGYSASQDTRPEEFKRRFSVATRGTQLDYGGFHFRPWTTVCAGLRGEAVGLIRGGNVLLAAMTLAFVGAVEQNVLGFPGQLLRRVSSGDTIWAGVELADYLGVWLSTLEKGVRTE